MNVKREIKKKQIEKRPILGSEVTHVVHVVLSKDGAAANGTVPGSTYLRAPVRAPSGTFVPHGSERRTLGRSTQLPNGPRYPSTTTEDLLRQGARLYTRARLPHMVVRALTCVAFQRNSPTAGRYVPLTFPSSLSAIVSRRLSILFQVHCQKFFALLAPMDLLHLCKNISATLCKYFSSCHLPTFSFAISSW